MLSARSGHSGQVPSNTTVFGGANLDQEGR